MARGQDNGSLDVTRAGWRTGLRRCAGAGSLLAASGAVLAAAGCSAGGDDAPPASRAAPTLVERSVVTGGSSRERELLRRVVDGMGGTTLRRVAIAPPAGRDDGSAVSITFTPVRGTTVRGQWDEWIVAGAFSRRLLAAGTPAEIEAADDRRAFTAQPRVDGEPDPRPLRPRREAAIVKAIRNAARQSDGGEVRVQVHRPFGAAVTLSVAPADPASYLRDRLRGLLDRVHDNRRNLEGIYVAVLDDRRQLVLEWGSWTRNPAGSYWVRRDLARCSPIQQSEPAGAEPPPACPAE